MKLRRPFSLCAATIALVGSCLGYLTTARAQDDPNTVSPQSPNAQQKTLDDLGAAFKWIEWDSDAHGLLLAIAPDKVSAPDDSNSDTPPDDADIVPGDDAAKPLFAPTGRYGLNAGLVARHFNRKLIHLPTMTVFAPTTMITLSHDLKPINPFAGMDTQEKMRRLEASLTPEQWKALGSESGLGIGDLSKEQQPLFEELIPESSDLKKAKVAESGGNYYDDPGDNAPISISAGQRQGLRIRLDRIASMNLMRVKGQQDYEPAFHADTVGKEKLVLVDKPDSFAKQSSVFGQQIRFKTANKLKPSDLDLKSPSLNVWVPVTGAATVGDLIAATRDATGLDIYVDGRLAKLTVTLKGGETPTVRAADLLEALCWSLTATYRQVGPTPANPKGIAYVLTHDREGLAVRRGFLTEWGQHGAALQYANQQKFDKSIKGLNPAQYLSFARDNLLNPTPEAEKAYHDFVPKQGEYFPTVPVSALTPDQRSQLQEGVKRISKEREANPNNGRDELRTDRVALQLNLTMTLIVPGVGEVQIDESWSDNTAPDRNAAAFRAAAQAEMPKPKPAHGTKIILSVSAPHDRAEADSLVQAAVSYGIRQLWVNLRDSETSGLADCIAAGQAHHLPVGTIVGLMHLPPASLPPLAENINVYGETGPQWAAHIGQFTDDAEQNPFLPDVNFKPADVVDPANAETEKQVQARITKIATIPGLSGLALYDAVLPGYFGSQGSTYSPSSNMTGSSFGYTLANRLAFLRQNGYDPIDIDTTSYFDGDVSQKVALPFFDTDGGDLQDDSEPAEDNEIDGKWQDYRAKQSAAELKALRSALLKDKPALPVYLTPASNTDEMQWGSAYRLWTKPDTLPLDSLYSQELLKQPALQKEAYVSLAFSHTLFESMTKQVPDYATKYTETNLLLLWLNSILEPDSKQRARMPQPEGVMLDLSAYSTGEVLTMTKGLFLPLETGKSGQ